MKENSICLQSLSVGSGEMKIATNSHKVLGKAVMEGIEIEDLHVQVGVLVRLIWVQPCSKVAGFTEKTFRKVSNDRTGT